MIAGIQTQPPPYLPGQGFQDPVVQAQEPARSPAASQQSNSPDDDHASFTVSVKVLSPSNKKHFKMYTLRNVVLSAILMTLWSK